MKDGPFGREDLINHGGSMVATFAPAALYDLRIYYTVMEGYLRSSPADRFIFLQSQSLNISPEVRTSLRTKENAGIWDDYFPSELRASVIVAVMSFFERYLHGVCQEVSMLLRTKVTHTQLKGSDMDQSMIFLTEVCGLTRPDRQHWIEMKTLQKLRNRLVHAGGFTDDPQTLNEYSRSFGHLPGCTISEFGIDIAPALIETVFETTDRFLSEVILGLKALCDRVEKFERKS